MLSGYTITENIYESLRTVVSRGIRLRDGLPVILKSIRAGYDKPVEIARLKHEHQLLSELKIKGVPKVIDLDPDHNTYTIVLEDVEGVTLRDFAGGKPLKTEQFLRIAIQLSSILSELHSKRIVHRDVKPGNIIIHPESLELQLIDFSLSTRSFSGQHVASGTGLLEGSLAYIAPEQTGRMNRPVDYRSDLYSLGVSFFELVTGQLPFHASHPLEWVHAHLAGDIPDPRQYAPDLPEPVGQIIRVLLSKTSEDRYQSAYSLKKDLEHCLSQYKAIGSVPSFRLSSSETYGLFMMPAKLYGREEEVRILTEYMDDVTRKNRFGFMLISGFSGIGKTTLVQEAYKQVSVANGRFCSGKFETLSRSVPYLGFIRAFSNLARTLLAEKLEVLETLKNELQQVAGANCGIITQLLPSFEPIIGRYPRPAPLGPEEEANRFQSTLRAFINTLTKRYPLIIFLDDLQWADAASLNLLELLAADQDIRNLGIICAYRSNEVGDGHPFGASIRKIERNMDVRFIELGNLAEQHVSALVADSFQRPYQDTIALAKLLMKKTEGNPFFIIQALGKLYEDGAIRFDGSVGEWGWDISQLEKLDISDNVLDLMLNRIVKLDPGTQKTLQIASCIGSSFNLSMLARLCAPEGLHALTQALEEGLILSRDDNYFILLDQDKLREVFYGNASTAEIQRSDARFRFLHDRVQQAAYSMLDEQETGKIHLMLGRSMLKSLADKDLNDEIFTVCNHFNASLNLLTDAEERLEVARLNLLAANRARNAAAYQQSLQYANTGLSLLPSNAHAEEYSLWFSLSYVSAETTYLLGHLRDGEAKLELLLRNSRDRVDKLACLKAMVSMYAVSNDREKVILTVSRALSLFGIDMPRGSIGTKVSILTSIGRIKWILRGRSFNELLELPRCEDEDHIRLAEILMQASPSVYLASQDLFAWIVLFETRLALQRGYTASSSQSLMGYGMILHTAFGDVDSAFRYAEFSRLLNRKLGSPYGNYRLQNIFNLFISHFRNGVEQDIAESPRLAREALGDGDTLYFGLNYVHLLCCRIFRGDNLVDTYEEGVLYLRQVRQLNNDYAYQLMQSRMFFIPSLTGLPALPHMNNWQEVGLDEKIAVLKADMGYSNLGFLYLSLYADYYFLDEYESRIEALVEDGYKIFDFIVGSFSNLDFALYQSLCCYKLMRSKGRNSFHRKIIRMHWKRLHKYMRTGAPNYTMFFHVVDLCLKLYDGKHAEVMENGEATVLKLAEGGFHLQAIVEELLGQLYLEQGQKVKAETYLLRSWESYSRWGAEKKKEMMEMQYGSIQFTGGTSARTTTVDPTSSVTQNLQWLDLESLMKSATAISGEIQLNSLLPSMINITTENAGASKGVLLIAEGQKLLPRIKREKSKLEAEFMEGEAGELSDELSVVALQMLQRSGEPVLVDNAFSDDRFARDSYVVRNKIRSIFCVPIIHKGVMKGAIYLENNLVSHGFSADRVSVIRILSSQIAVSLDNAMLYRDLENALHKQVELTEAYSRFTPKEYLKFLGHNSILDVRLGDYRVETMTVLFTDIRSYTSIAEQFTAEENFHFLRNYFRKMTEIVARHKGMVNQLLGDGILAFFDDADNALATAVEMQEALQDYHIMGKGGVLIPVKAGAGLHRGDVIIGIMGSETSMDTGIVSDTVNVASRIEGLTKHFGASILLSETVAEKLQEGWQGGMRSIGRVIMKGKHQDVGIFECFNGDVAAQRQWKASHISRYNQALQLYTEARFPEALDEFEQLLQENPDDKLVRYYHAKCLPLSSGNIPEDWSPIEDVKTK